MRRLVAQGLRKVLAGLGMVGALLLMGAAPTPPASPSEGVQVPVVLDGVRYEPEEFNRIEADLRRRGILLCFTVARDGTLHAFSNYLQGCEEFLQKEWGLPPKPLVYPPPVHPFRVRVEGKSAWVELIPEPASSDRSSKITPLQFCPPPDPYWSLNWEHILCQGNWFAVPPQSAIADLRQIPGPCAGSWNDCISSAQAASGIRSLILWEHINFQGTAFEVPGGWTAPDLRAFNWNDRASSLYAQP